MKNLIKLMIATAIMTPVVASSQETSTINEGYQLTELTRTQEKAKIQKKEQKRIHMPESQASQMLKKNAQRKQEKAQEMKNENSAQKQEETAQKMLKKSDDIDAKNSQIKNKIQNKGNYKKIKHMEKHGYKGKKIN